jgi:hypothetical protein
VADFIYNSTGVGDLFSNWMAELVAYAEAQGWSSIWGLITGGLSGLLSAAIIIVGFIIYPISYLVFTVFYALYGSVLYVVGPFVLALLPIRGVGQLARTYAINVMVFGAWGLIYAIVQVLMSAINLNSIAAVLNANGVLNSFVGSGSMILLALVSILFSISIAFIPYIASRVVRGDVGSTMFAILGAAATAASVAATAAGKAVMSGGAGFNAATSGGGDRSPGGEGGGGAVMAGGSGRAEGYSSRPPRPLSSETSTASSAFDGGPAAASSSTSNSQSPPPPPRPSQEGSRPTYPRQSGLANRLFWWSGYGLGRLWGPGRTQ